MRRKINGKHWTVLAQTLGYGEEGGLYAQVDDGNPAWEEMPWEDIEAAEIEKIWREDDMRNGEKVVQLPEGSNTKEYGHATMAKTYHVRLITINITMMILILPFSIYAKLSSPHGKELGDVLVNHLPES